MANRRRSGRIRFDVSRRGSAPRVLVVADQEPTRELLQRRLEVAGFLVEVALDGLSAWRFFQSQAVDLVVTELPLPRLDGVGLTRRIRSTLSRDPRIPVLLITGSATLSMAAAAGRAGVTDCFSLDETGLGALMDRMRDLTEVDQPLLPCELVGTSPGVAAARERIFGVAQLHTPVLITGETGTGHVEVAAFLHALSRRSREKLHRVACHLDPAVTGGDLPGLWYLQEIQDLSPEAQRAWCERIVEAEGGAETSTIRVIASTTKDLRYLASQKRFSADLARELCQFEIWLPPLRERQDDLPKLFQAILERVSERIGRPGIGISAGALQRLCACAWWENFPELENVLESLAAFAPALEITEQQAELVLIDSDPIARAARERARSEREQLLALLEECGGNFTHMADRLKVDRGTIRYRLRKHGILPRGSSRSGS